LRRQRDKKQKPAANLMDVQSAEKLAKYPDFVAAEALGRIPGVAVAGDTAKLESTTFAVWAIGIRNHQRQINLYGICTFELR
jgi:hypothetical protein